MVIHHWTSHVPPWYKLVVVGAGEICCATGGSVRPGPRTRPLSARHPPPCTARARDRDTAFASPRNTLDCAADREQVRSAASVPFVEVLVDTPLAVCEAQLSDPMLAATLAAEAGALLLTLREQNGLTGKDLGKRGDQDTDELLLRRLAEQRPDAVLPEESVDSPARLTADRVWIIDPLDATRDYGLPPRPDRAVHLARCERGPADTPGAITAAAVAQPSNDGRVRRQQCPGSDVADGELVLLVSDKPAANGMGLSRPGRGRPRGRPARHPGGRLTASLQQRTPLPTRPAHRPTRPRPCAARSHCCKLTP